MNARLFLTFETIKRQEKVEIKRYINVIVIDHSDLQNRLRNLLQECKKEKEQLRFVSIYIVTKCSSVNISYSFGNIITRIEHLRKDLNVMLGDLKNANDPNKEQAYKLFQDLGINQF